MKITGIRIDRFGVWRDLSLSSFDSGLNVIYGPNETGKSTLMRFVRGMLYGFRPSGPQLRGVGDRSFNCKGLLRIAHDGEQHDIGRPAGQAEHSVATINGTDDPGPANETLYRLLSGTSEAMFERLFAVDLHELQELATLAGDELADRVYGLTLGPEGRAILDAWNDLGRRRDGLFNPQDKSGRLAELFRRDAKLAGEIESSATLRERHVVLSHERDELNEEINRRKRRQAHLQWQQRGHRFLAQAWPAWNRVRELRDQLEELPILSGFPEDGLERLAKIDGQIDSLARCRKSLLAEARQLRDESQAGEAESSPAAQASRAAAQALCEDRDRVAELLREVAAAETRAVQAAEQRDAAVDALGPEWTVQRLEAADTSPVAQLRLLDAARSYHGRLDRRGRVRRRYKLRAAACSRQARELNERRKAAGDGTIAEQVFASSQRLSQLEELNRLRSREAELEQRRLALSDRLARIDDRPPLPAWAGAVLGFFGILGVVFALVGFYTGLTVNGVVGLMYALLGTACGGTAHALKTHVETTTGENVERLSDELRDVEVRLRETRDEMARLQSPRAAARGTETTALAESSVAELIVQQARQLAELERLAEAEQRVASRRNKMSERRSQVRQAQHDVISARRGWCEVLKQLGLKETLRVDEAFDEWQRVLEARDAQGRCRSAERELAAARRPLDELRQSIGRLAGQLGWDGVDEDDPLTVLDVWSEQLESDRRQRAERRRLRGEAKGRLREAAAYRRRILKCRMRRAALLVQGGASSREEFEERAACVVRRKELEAALFAASAELETICRSEPELAIVEEDMLAFSLDENAEQLAEIESALRRMESDRQQLIERLGSVKQELADAESDRRGASLRFNRARLADELKQAAEEWFALELAAGALGATQREFERSHQPATLAAATKYLAQLTRGRYRNVWTPLGRQRLCVDDERGRSFSVEQLSGGAREQLFLAIRLAIVEELRRQGVELPMVLDDVFANFDQSRTEAAVETLLELAGGGQQILLLTCHLHLAHLAEGKGGHVIWLPGNRAGLEERMAG